MAGGDYVSRLPARQDSRSWEILAAAVGKFRVRSDLPAGAGHRLRLSPPKKRTEYKRKGEGTEKAGKARELCRGASERLRRPRGLFFGRSGYPGSRGPTSRRVRRTERDFCT